MDTWWHVWDVECSQYLETYDLGWVPILNGRTAVVCWLDGDVPKIMVDRPLAESLVARDAGFMLVPAIRAAVREFCSRGGVATIAMGRAERRRRQQWLKEHPAQAS